MTDMVSPYLERPVRALDRVLEDRVLEDQVLEDQVLEDGGPVPPEAPRPASAAPVGPPVGLPVGSNPDLDARRLDPIGVLVCLLMSGHGAGGGNETAPVEAPAAAAAASRLNGRRAA